MAGEGQTNYVWEVRTRQLASWLLYLFPVSVNTYEDHPTGWGRSSTSVDCWSAWGRGVSIPQAVGDQVHEYLMSDDSPCEIDWIIWRGWIWSRGGGWQEYWDSTDMHYDHVHVTIV